MVQEERVYFWASLLRARVSQDSESHDVAGTQWRAAFGKQDGLAAKVSSWCVSVFQARSQCFAYSATKAHWRVLFSSWPFGSYEQMTGRLADSVFPAFQDQCWGWQEERPRLKAWRKGEFNEGLLGYLLPGQHFILGDDGGGAFGPFIGQLLSTSPSVGTCHAWSHVILTRALGMRGSCYVHFTEKKIEAWTWSDLSPGSNG